MLRRLVVVARAEELATPEELSTARAVGRLLADNGITLVHDGREVGAMGLAVETCAQAGGRLAQAAPLSVEAVGTVDAYLALPHGFSALDDAFAIWASPAAAGRELPVGLLDDGEYYSGLLRHATDSTLDHFVRESQRGRLIMAKRPDDLLRRLSDYKPPETRRGNDFE